MSLRVEIQPSMIDWAISRIALSDEELVKAFPKIHDWKAGTVSPTLRQAKELAKKARLPFGRLLLDEPTGEDLGLPDFRTVRNEKVERISSDLEEVIKVSQRRIAWYADYAAEVGIEPPSIVSSARTDDSPRLAAGNIRETMGWSPQDRITGADKVGVLAAEIEKLGVLVARNSIVESSTRRPLSVSEFRGFTLIDEGYSLIFINTRDSKTAQLFSLAHELGHTALGQPGISDHSEGRRTETWCNRFAAEFLVPEVALIPHVRNVEHTADTIASLSRSFGISRESMIWRLVELRVIDRSKAQSLLRDLSNWVNEETTKSGEVKIQRPVIVRARVGRRFFDTVTHAAISGEVSAREAARYLGAKDAEAFGKLVEFQQGVA